MLPEFSVGPCKPLVTLHLTTSLRYMHAYQCCIFQTLKGFEELFPGSRPFKCCPKDRQGKQIQNQNSPKWPFQIGQKTAGNDRTVTKSFSLSRPPKPANTGWKLSTQETRKCKKKNVNVTYKKLETHTHRHLVNMLLGPSMLRVFAK